MAISIAIIVQSKDDCALLQKHLPLVITPTLSTKSLPQTVTSPILSTDNSLAPQPVNHMNLKPVVIALLMKIKPMPVVRLTLWTLTVTI